MRPTKTARFFAAKFFKAADRLELRNINCVSDFDPRERKSFFDRLPGLSRLLCLYSGIFTPL
jgi:hypothetical protein